MFVTIYSHWATVHCDGRNSIECCVMWPWERHNISEPPFSYIENVDNTCLIYFTVSCEDKMEKQF